MENDSDKFSNYANDPEQISEYLIERYGSRDNAIAVAVDGTTQADRSGDLYSLSVWRDVKRTLRNSNSR